MAYVVWRDELVDRARSILPATAALRAAGHKNRDGSEIELQDPWQVAVDFDAMLNQPLNYLSVKAAMLREVMSA